MRKSQVFSLTRPWYFNPREQHISYELKSIMNEYNLQKFTAKYQPQMPAKFPAESIILLLFKFSSLQIKMELCKFYLEFFKLNRLKMIQVRLYRIFFFPDITTELLKQTTVVEGQLQIHSHQTNFGSKETRSFGKRKHRTNCIKYCKLAYTWSFKCGVCNS